MDKCSIIPIIANSILNGGCRITPRFVGANGLESLQFFFFFFALSVRLRAPPQPHFDLLTSNVYISWPFFVKGSSVQ